MAHYIFELNGPFYNLLGFSTCGIHKDTGTEYGPDGYD